jgi:hypothetical protein
MGSAGEAQKGLEEMLLLALYLGAQATLKPLREGSALFKHRTLLASIPLRVH